MFAIYMAVICFVALVLNGVRMYYGNYSNRKKAIEEGKDHYFDQNLNLVHVNDNLPYMYRNINGDVYEVNPYSFKIRRNITKERDVARLLAFRKIAKERGIRFVKDETDYNTVHKSEQKCGLEPARDHYEWRPYIDTETGNVYIQYSYGRDIFGIDFMGDMIDKEDEKHYVKYLMNPSTGFIEGVNTDLLDMDEKYIFETMGGRVKSKPTEELINGEIDMYNEQRTQFLNFWGKYEKDAENAKKERELQEEMIKQEITNIRARGENFL